MNWIRTILDGLAMAAHCNLVAISPPAVIRTAPRPPTKEKNRFYRRWIFLGELLPLILYGALNAAERGTRGFWNLALTGYVRWMRQYALPEHLLQRPLLGGFRP